MSRYHLYLFVASAIFTTWHSLACQTRRERQGLPIPR
jgi:hypothetical protein